MLYSHPLRGLLSSAAVGINSLQRISESDIGQTCNDFGFYSHLFNSQILSIPPARIDYRGRNFNLLVVRLPLKRTCYSRCAAAAVVCLIVSGSITMTSSISSLHTNEYIRFVNDQCQFRHNEPATKDLLH
ncbi:hypothetical protein HAX54_050020, partial [Datura stramonium]|nr:hypothetical protein [Datura stramonium]